MTELSSIEQEEQVGVCRPAFRIMVEVTHTDPDYTNVLTVQLEHDDPHALARAGSVATIQGLASLLREPEEVALLSNDPHREFTDNSSLLLRRRP